MKDSTPNHVPAVLVYATHVDDDPGTYVTTTYRVAAWRCDGMALVIVPGHAVLVAADNIFMLGETCWGVQLIPSWDFRGSYEHVKPRLNGPFH